MQAPIVFQYPQGLPAESMPEPTTTSVGSIVLIYLLVAAYFLVRFGRRIYAILSMAAKCDKSTSPGFTQIHISHSDTAFSFFNLLFLRPGTDTHGIIFHHEMVHIRQKHSLDIIFFELLLILNWFNPLCWLIRRDIKLIHEYIADEATTNHGLAKHEYAMFLIHNSLSSFSNPLTSQIFNQSILKNRINMLNKNKTAGRVKLRLMYLLPITGGMLCASTLGFSKDYATVDLYAKTTQATIPLTSQEPEQTAKTEKKNTYPIETVVDQRTGDSRPVKLIVINGRVSKAKNFISVTGYDQVKELNNREAVAKYGTGARKGALEFTGKNAGISVKFPPPLVAKNAPSTPPMRKNAPPTPPKRKDDSIKPVKFPPPLIEPLKKHDKTKPTAEYTPRI